MHVGGVVMYSPIPKVSGYRENLRPQARWSYRIQAQRWLLVGINCVSYPLSGLRLSKIITGTLRIVIHCKLMVAIMLSHLNIQNRISIIVLEAINVHQDLNARKYK